MDKPDALGESNDLVIGEDGLARPAWAAAGMLRTYYDTEWGNPVRDERGVFERVSLEVFQSGLSWSTILAKREAFREAFHHFDPERIARYTEKDVARLMSNGQIIRNAAKISATINNAQATLAMREHGGLADFVWSFKPSATPEPVRFSDIPTSSEQSVALAAALRKRGFKFVGPTNMFAMMEAIGIVDTHLVGSYRRGSSGVWITGD